MSRFCFEHLGNLSSSWLPPEKNISWARFLFQVFWRTTFFFIFYFSRCFTILGPNWFILLNSVLSRLSLSKLCQETFPKRLLVTYDVIHLLLPFLCLCCECVCVCVCVGCVCFISVTHQKSLLRSFLQMLNLS